MYRFWLVLYNVIIIPILNFFLRVMGLFNEKISRGIKGRKRLFEDLQLKVQSLDRTKKLIWFHSASLGEFEQAKPVIEFIRGNYSVNILVTFFSPSGYENAKNYALADITSYIPFDSNSLAERFLDISRPSMAVFVRYDLWPNHLYLLHKRGIPAFLITATLLQSSMRKSVFARSFHRYLFSQLTAVMTISESDRKNFLDLISDERKVTVVGDTRFDRVHQMSLAARSRNLLRPEIINDKKIFVAGSTWDEDEDVLLLPLLTMLKYTKDLLIILVPHEPTLPHIERTESILATHNFNSIRFSGLNQYNGEPIIIVDSIGILLTLYSYANIAFVGGSFKSNIHNVLEAAVYGIPVVYGPKINNSQEAIELARLGGGVVFRNRQECYRAIRTLMSDDAERARRGAISKTFINANLGATGKIMDTISKYI